MSGLLDAPEAPAGERFTRWSPDLPGFGVRHRPSGVASFVVQTRMHARLRTITIGRVNLIGEKEARQIARHILLRAQTGENPADARLRARSSPSFVAFLETYWRLMEERWKPSTQESNGIYRRRYLDMAFPSRFIDEIATEDVQRWFVETTDVAGPGGANRMLSMLGAIFAKAELWGLRPEESNPCRDIRRNRARRFQRFLSDGELARVGAVLAGNANRSPIHVAAVRMLLLTGCRRSEIMGLRWSDVRGSRIQLRDDKAGARTVWLGEEACVVLRGLTRYPGQPAVFYNHRRRKPIADLTSFWARMREEAGVPDVRLHDLRHSFASYAARSSETLPMIGKLLGHRKLGSTSRYAHLDDAHILQAAQDIGDAIEAMSATGVRGEGRP